MSLYLSRRRMDAAQIDTLTSDSFGYFAHGLITWSLAGPAFAPLEPWVGGTNLHSGITKVFGSSDVNVNITPDGLLIDTAGLYKVELLVHVTHTNTGATLEDFSLGIGAGGFPVETSTQIIGVGPGTNEPYDIHVVAFVNCIAGQVLEYYIQRNAGPNPSQNDLHFSNHRIYVQKLD